MEKKSTELETDSLDESAAAYERWKNNSWFRPIRSGFWGLGTIGIAGVVLFDDYWNTPFRWVLIGVGLLLGFGFLRLFFDIPQRRLRNSHGSSSNLEWQYGPSW